MPRTAKNIIQVKHSVYITLMLCGIHLLVLIFLVTSYHINLFANCNFTEANPLNNSCIDFIVSYMTKYNICFNVPLSLCFSSTFGENYIYVCLLGWISTKRGILLTCCSVRVVYMIVWTKYPMSVVQTPSFPLPLFTYLKKVWTLYCYHGFRVQIYIQI